jgi:hypothetical protein
MQRLIRVRLGTVAAVVVTSAITVCALAVPADATIPQTACTNVTITTKGVGTLKGCNNAKQTGGSGKLVVNTKKAPYTGTFTWNKTGTTKASLTYSGLKKGVKSVCPAGKTQINVTGKVTGGTGAALKGIPKGAKVSAKLCYKGTSLTLAPKTKFTL